MQSLQVVEPWCDCGCVSLNFHNEHQGMHPIADAFAVYSDGTKAGLILFARGSTIVLLEVHDLDENSSHRVPELADLRTWEQMGEKLATT